MIVIPNLEMMRIQIETLFVADEKNSLIATNNLERSEAPRLTLSRSTSGNIWRFHENANAGLRKKLSGLLNKEPPLSPKQLDAPPAFEAKIKAILESDAPVSRVFSGPAFYFSEAPEAAQIPETAIHLTRFNKDLLVGDLIPWGEDVDADMPLFASLSDSEAVSVCGSVRQGEKAHEAGVETLPGHRRKGHATAAIKAWAHHTAAQDILPLYSTSWENEASRGTAKKLGLTFYASNYHWF